MEDSGVDSINLKTFMQQGKAALLMAEQIGSAIGEFIGGMHKWGRGNAGVLDAVRGNEQAKAMVLLREIDFDIEGVGKRWSAYTQVKLSAFRDWEE